MKLSLLKVTAFGIAMVFTSHAFAGENRTAIRSWAKTTEKRSAVMAGGFVSIPKSGTKQVEEKKEDEKKMETKDTK